jgi:hypothetical protein
MRYLPDRQETGRYPQPPFDMKNYDFVYAGSGIRVHLLDSLHYRPDAVPPTAGRHRKMVLCADSKKCVVFAPYSGCEFGPREALPAMMLLELELEHIGFQKHRPVLLPRTIPRRSHGPDLPRRHSREAQRKGPHEDRNVHRGTVGGDRRTSLTGEHFGPMLPGSGCLRGPELCDNKHEVPAKAAVVCLLAEKK